jgi:hypothetical protein
MFDVWIATLILGPIALTGVVGYFSWGRLAYPKVFVAIGVIVLWGVATWIAMDVLANIGIAGVAPGAETTGETDHFARHLCATLLIFLAVSIVLLLGLRLVLLKRSIVSSRE